MKHGPELGAIALWAVVIAVSLWLPGVAGGGDVVGFYVVLLMLVCIMSSAALGVFLGRAHACRLVAACAVLAPLPWIADFTVVVGSGVRSLGAVGVAVLVALAAVFVVAPLLAGAVAGRGCPTGDGRA